MLNATQRQALIVAAQVKYGPEITAPISQCIFPTLRYVTRRVLFISFSVANRVHSCSLPTGAPLVLTLAQLGPEITSDADSVRALLRSNAVATRSCLHERRQTSPPMHIATMSEGENFQVEDDQDVTEANHDRLSTPDPRSPIRLSTRTQTRRTQTFLLGSSKTPQQVALSVQWIKRLQGQKAASISCALLSHRYPPTLPLPLRGPEYSCPPTSYPPEPPSSILAPGHPPR